MLRLVAGVVLMNAFVYLLVGAALYQSHLQYERQTTLSTQNLAQTLALSVSGTIKKIDVSLYAVTHQVEAQMARGQVDWPDLHDWVQRQHQLSPELDGMRITDAQGNLQYAEDIRPNARLNMADRPFFKQLINAPRGAMVISEPLVSRITHTWGMVLARRITAPDGQFAGVVSGFLPLDYFRSLFLPLDIGPHGLITLRDTQLHLWIRIPEIEGVGPNAGNTAVSQSTADMVRQHPEGATYETVVKLDGVRRRMAFRRVEGQPLYIFVGEATQDYLAGWYRELEVSLALAFGFTLITLGAANNSYRRRRNELATIEQLRRSKEDAERSGTRFRTLYNATGDAVWLRDGDHIIDCNAAALRMLGADSVEQLRQLTQRDYWAPVQANGRDAFEFGRELVETAFKDGSVRFEWLFKRLDNGLVFPTEISLNALELDGHPILQLLVRDITARKAAEEQIRHLAYFDPLTNLPNRRLLMDRLQQALAASAASGEMGALMILDLDNFKVLNDTQGHAVGDRLLLAVAQRIQSCLRPRDTVSRLGGDEYVVMLESLGTDRASAEAQAKGYAEQIRNALDQPYSILDEEVGHHSTASIGVTVFADHAVESSILLKQADVALYQAKAAGRNAVRFFSPAMQEAINARSAMEAALRHSLQGDGFRLFYQPQVNLDTGLIGAEALIRWFPEQHQAVSPAQFIPVAEDSGLIIPLGYWVMQTACRQLRLWANDARTRDLKIAINVSARQFHQPDYVERVREALQESGANPARLQLELTESVVLENVDEVVERMQQIRALGVTFSLDDFGTGFSSLSYLKRLPLDQIKIDQSFVRDVMTSANDAAIVRAIVAIAQSLGLQVIAEGVENQAQLDFLTETGCRVCQGYLFGRPEPIEDWTV
ncbi:bifunctional diguanylate cyclase/phosphodiesterase [Amantichitinum ursilacus]|uniref:bifunctional diguanylate cyclase/phosphodiesterase n=1 Tax=Amantichitinum ursilacus TaxID=857265 RepID=UPI0013792039|nr:EAL domain-containing protein [Amantichitinum ursilacus]